MSTPGVNESRSYFDAYKVAPRENDRVVAERCSVGFWNLTDKPMRLAIDGQSQVLASGKNVVVDLRRQFVWRVEGRDPQSESVPTTESAIEIVIRR
jgi:hypothetical protein